MTMRRAKEWFEAMRAEDPELNAEYEAMGPRFEAIRELISARKKAGLSQTALAKKMGVSQAVIGRLESGQNSPTIDTLAKAARALGGELVVHVRKQKARQV